MQASEKNKVSLRGASVKEITRDALLEKTAKERAERSHARKVLHATSLIQCVWRGRSAACEAAESFRVEWDTFVAGGQYMDYQTLSVDRLCKCIIRPFLFFAGHHRSCLHRDRKNIGADDERFVTCFKILLQSINCPDPAYNFCTLCIGSKEQKITWSFQVHELLNLCCIALVESSAGTEGVTSLATLSIRLMVALTDANLWKSISHVKNDAEAVRALQGILEWIVDRNTGFYPALRIFILQFCPFPSFNVKQDTSKEKFVTIASALTLALRPLQCFSNNVKSAGISVDYICGNYSFLARKSAEHFCKEILTIPFLTNRLPSAILPALRHASAFVPSLQAFVTSANHIFQGASVSISFASKPTYPLTPHVHIPLCACALANVVTLASASSVKCPRNGVFPGQFVDGLDYPLYVKAVCALLDCMTPWADSLKNLKKGILQDVREEEFSITDNEKAHDLQYNIMLVVEALGPLHQRWHLEQLLDRTSISFHSQHAMHANVEPELMACISLPDVARLYASLMNAFSSLNPISGALPILNVLAFTQDLLLKLWNWLDGALSLGGSSSAHIFKESRMCASENLQESKVMQDGTFGQNLSRKWSSAVSKLKGKHFSSQSIDGGICKISLEECISQEQELTTGSWNVVNLRKGAAGISDEAVSVFLLFCALYAHLLLVLDDEEFYERQVPFSLEQQRTISASLNTMLYNEFFSSSRHCFSSLLEAGTRCLHSLYMRDCRRPFCPPSLWLAPAVSNRPPVAAAARAHEVAVASIRTGELSQAPAMGYVLTTFPHVWPFEERVQIFREFVTSDKICRKMAGESIGPGPGSIEIAIRRGHIVEDGFAQLNHLGAKLKTGLNVSFVNEHGLQEAGLDYGGLFKEFLTDLAKAAFDPGYGLFTQTATEERLLFPHPASASLGHGLQMFEFLGRIVGKALYEGILLDYSFSHVFIWALLGRYSFLDELSTLDPELHRNLMYLKYYEGDARELALDFTVTEEIFGKRIVVELRAGGQKISVTNENKLQYIHAIADYKLNRQLKPLVNAFAKGFSDLIEPDWLGLFNAREFNQLLSGGEHDFDVDDLKSNTQYTGGYTESSRIIKFFWQVLREFKPQERCALLKFVTSCSRAPLLGFKYLQPAFTIHKVACNTPVWSMLGGEDVQRLPSASTCYNTLKLPTYKRVATLRSKLQYAIHSNAGFELS